MQRDIVQPEQGDTTEDCIAALHAWKEFVNLRSSLLSMRRDQSQDRSLDAVART
jgi:hypothetical protein